MARRMDEQIAVYAILALVRLFWHHLPWYPRWNLIFWVDVWL